MEDNFIKTRKISRVEEMTKKIRHRCKNITEKTVMLERETMGRHRILEVNELKTHKPFS
jgi:hypothetical protein